MVRKSARFTDPSKLGAAVSAIFVFIKVQAQTCPVRPDRDVLLFLDNSGWISDTEFNEAQVAVAEVAAEVLAHPGKRLAIVNWAYTATSFAASAGTSPMGLATGSAVPGGWSTNPTDFAYVGPSSPGNKVCHSFGNSSSQTPSSQRLSRALTSQGWRAGESGTRDVQQPIGSLSTPPRSKVLDGETFATSISVGSEFQFVLKCRG